MTSHRPRPFRSRLAVPGVVVYWAQVEPGSRGCGQRVGGVVGVLVGVGEWRDALKQKGAG